MPQPRALTGGARASRGHGRALVGVVASAALAVVTWSTDAAFLYASGSTFAEYVEQRVERGVIDSVTPGERLCVARQPFTFLYAPAFHEHRKYSVQEATSSGDCESTDRQVP